MIQARGKYAVIGFPWNFVTSMGRPGSRERIRTILTQSDNLIK